jgi:hypothetical protein
LICELLRLVELIVPLQRGALDGDRKLTGPVVVGLKTALGLLVQMTALFDTSAGSVRMIWIMSFAVTVPALVLP